MSGSWVVRLPTWLGDTVMALPVLRALQRARPDPLLLWGPPAMAEITALAGLSGDYLSYRRRRGAAGVSDAVHAVAALRHRRLEAAVLLPNAFEPALLAAIAGIPRRVGYATDGRRRLLTEPLPPLGERPPLHEADRFARLLAAAGAPAPEPDDGGIVAGESVRRRGVELLTDADAALGIVAGSANAPAKRWPAAAYAELAERAARQWGAQTVLLGSAADHPVHDEIRARAGVDLVDLAGCSLADLAAALTRCRVVVGNDTGAVHLAAALGRPTVVLFGPTDPRRSCPRGASVLPIAVDCYCQPCRAHVCPLDHRCMLELPSTAVLGAIEPLWQAAS